MGGWFPHAMRSSSPPPGLPFTPDGLVTHAQASMLGRGDALRRLHRTGTLERVARGAYRLPLESTQPAMEREAQHYLHLVLAASRRLHRPVFTGYSAAALYQLPIVGRWPRDVYVLGTGAHGSRRPGIVTVAQRQPLEVVELDGRLLTSVEHTLIQLARVAPLGTALVATDAALRDLPYGDREPLTTLERLTAAHEALRPYHRSARVQAVLGRATFLADGPLESASRLVIEELGFATPVLQRVISLPVSGRDAYLDFYWEEQNVAGEADGHGKYLGEGGASTTASRIVAEKQREDEIREQVAGLLRWDWQDMWRRRPLEQKLLRAGIPRVRPPSRLL